MNDKIDNWKDRFEEIISSCQNEIKRTAEIGKKMISASKANTDLNDCYQEMGKHFYQQIKAGKIVVDDPNVDQYMSRVEKFKSSLEQYEEQVRLIKEQKKL